MPRIAVLPSDLINQIAAGEVVERPASVVKELVENAIDAGATAIDVILEGGGRQLVEVRDNGCGMTEQDARLAIERHATSKIRHFDDLARVRSLGFRGEALPSIASVSRFSLVTADESASHATEITVDPLTGERSVRPAARDRGTTVSVGELFENVPARRKFLRSADAEFRSIVTVVASYALSLPKRSFRLEHNGRVTLDFPAAASDRDRVVQVLGSETDPHLEALEGEPAAIRVRGFVTRGLRFGSRRNQYFFVNGRLVRDRVLTHAANRACDAFDFEGHPAIVLFLDVEPELVDVNVHPAKTEVRFRDSGAVHVAVERAVRRALGGAEEGAALLKPPVREEALFPPQRFDAPSTIADFTPLFHRSAAPLVQPPLAREGATALAADPLEGRPESGPDLGALQGRVIGQYRMSFILLDVPGGLRIVDQHVAHERVLYDRLWERMASGSAVSQQLLTPILYECGGAESAVLESHVSELCAAGFEIERFSGNTFAISAVPPELVRNDPASFLRRLIDASLEEKGSHVVRVRERVCASLACQAAIKVHRTLSGEEMSRLVGELLASSNPYACPHGRPIIVDIRHPDVERHFHRR
ncbi:MAG TPA: DNA mismatch repair endonuclease MutL [Thermoanaerobaculia bacterium]|nr:DNA mismatch repair endonuclease MutL [Thermoanaerobaculia bacterium]